LIFSLNFHFLHQADEIEALSAIYGDEWCVVDEDASTFCIRIDKDQEAVKNAQELSVCLQVSVDENLEMDFVVS
jgi:hypothetical protein